MQDDSFRPALKSLLAAAALVVLLAAAWAVVDLLVLVFGAVVVSVLIRSLADPMAGATRIGEAPSVIAAMLLILGVFALVGWLFGAQLSGQVSQLFQTLPSALAEAEQRFPLLPSPSELMQRGSGSGGDILTRIGSTLMTVASGITDLLLVLFGSIFIALRPSYYKEGLVLLVPQRHRGLARQSLEESGRALRKWLLGQLVSMVTIGILTGFGLWLVGVPSALALGLIAGLAEIIPYAGPLLAAIPVLLLAFAEGPQTALYALIVILVVQQIESSLIMPLVQKKAVSLPPALTVFGVVAAGLMFGTVGLIFAAPLLVVAYVMVKRIYVSSILETPVEVPGSRS